MQSKYRLKKREDFRRVFRHGKSFANRQFVVYMLSRKEPDNMRLGISVSKKVGNAIVRNRIKRLVKEIIRGWVQEVNPGMDLVIIARKPAADMDFYQVRSSLRHLLVRSGVCERLVIPGEEKKS